MRAEGGICDKSYGMGINRCYIELSLLVSQTGVLSYSRIIFLVKVVHYDEI